MSAESLLENLANSTAIIYDRTVNPPLQIGQGFMVSKSRLATCASAVFHYIETPWALQLEFPYTDLILGVKAIALHFEFDKKQARSLYLAQSGDPYQDQLKMPNDIAMLVLDSDLQELNADKVAELNRALYSTYSVEGIDLSGTTNDIEFLDVIKKLFNEGQSGLFTLLSSRKIPVAQIEISPQGITNVLYKQMKGELAFFELVCNNTAQAYTFSTTKKFNFAPNCNIQAPTVKLAMEALRRHAELPKLLENLGGKELRFQQVVNELDLNNVSEGIKWFAPKLWECIDGYITLEKLPLKLNLDSFTVAVGIKEFVNKGLISPINKYSPFPCSGEMGSPIMAHTDLEIHPLDAIQAFYLDPYSFKATLREGTFFGSASALQPKNLLHTIDMPPNIYGAQILKSYKLVGVHSGPYKPKTEQTNLPKNIFQFMWIGALIDMSTKRLRGSNLEGGEDEEIFVQASKLKATLDEANLTPKPKIKCPKCFANNTKYGPCDSCSYEITDEEANIKPKGKELALRILWDVKEKYNLTDMHLMFIGGMLVWVFFMIVGLIFNKPAPTVAIKSNETQKVIHSNSSKASLLASQSAGFSQTPPAGYWYEDTSEQTNPIPSFGLYSDNQNQKLLFIIMNNMSCVEHLEKFTNNPVYIKTDDFGEIGKKIADGSQPIGNDQLKWFVGTYPLPPKDKEFQTILIGAYPSPLESKAVLVIGTSMDNHTDYNYRNSLFIIDLMAREYTKSVEQKAQSDNTNSDNTDTSDKTKSSLGNTDTNNKSDQTATADATNSAAGNNSEESSAVVDNSPVSQFCKSTQVAIQSKFFLSDDVKEELKKPKYTNDNTLITISLQISNKGEIKKLDITQTASLDKLTDAVVKAVKQSEPFKNIPNDIASENLIFKITYYKGNFEVAKE